MTDANNEIRNFYSAEDLTALDKKFLYMLAGQTVAIIIADPALTSRRTIVNGLKQAGFENLSEARSGFEALEAAKKNGNLRLVAIVDEALSGGMDAFTCMREFRKVAPTGVIFMVSPKVAPTKISELQALKVSAIFPRPVPRDAMLAKFRELKITPDG